MCPLNRYGHICEQLGLYRFAFSLRIKSSSNTFLPFSECNVRIFVRVLCRRNVFLRCANSGILRGRVPYCTVSCSAHQSVINLSACWEPNISACAQGKAFIGDVSLVVFFLVPEVSIIAYFSVTLTSLPPRIFALLSPDVIPSYLPFLRPFHRQHGHALPDCGNTPAYASACLVCWCTLRLLGYCSRLS